MRLRYTSLLQLQHTTFFFWEDFVTRGKKIWPAVRSRCRGSTRLAQNARTKLAKRASPRGRPLSNPRWRRNFGDHFSRWFLTQFEIIFINWHQNIEIFYWFINSGSLIADQNYFDDLIGTCSQRLGRCPHSVTMQVFARRVDRSASRVRLASQNHG